MATINISFKDKLFDNIPKLSEKYLEQDDREAALAVDRINTIVEFCRSKKSSVEYICVNDVELDYLLKTRLSFKN